MLTEREKWLMQKAWEARCCGRFYSGDRNVMDGWLNEETCDTGTVEMVLAAEAPRDLPLEMVTNMAPAFAKLAKIAEDHAFANVDDLIDRLPHFLY